MTNFSEMMRPQRAVTLKSLLSESNTRHCLLLAAIPIVLSIVNSSWLYTEIGSLDPWVNVGYFLHYSDPTFFNYYYKIARLSWIIPGFVAYHVFQPIVANYLLHMGCLLVTIVFFFLTVTRLFGRTIALATAACFAIFVPYHGGLGGWDYQNAPAGAYYVVAFYLLTSAVLSKNMRIRLALAGAAYACAVDATVSFINLAPILVAHFIVLYRERFSRLPSWRTVVLAGFWCVCGAAAVIVLLGLVNVAIGRDFLFFKDLIAKVFEFVSNNQSQAPWWLPWSSGWYLQVWYLYYLAPIVAALIGCIASSLLAIVAPRNAVALSLQLQNVFVAMLWVIWQSLGQTSLQPEWFAYPLYPVLFFGLAGLAATWQPGRLSAPATILFCGVLGVIATVSLAYGMVGITLNRWSGQRVEVWLVVSALLFVGLFAASRGRPLLIAAAVFAFCASNALGVAVTGRSGLYAFHQACRIQASEFRGVLDTHRFLAGFVPRPEAMYVWWNKNQTLHDRYGCTMSLANFAYSTVSSGFQYLAPAWPGMPDVNELPASSVAVINGSKALAVLTTDSSDLERMIAQFAQSGVRLAVEGQEIVRISQFSFHLYVLRAAARDD
jgi:hypothetical protein